MQKKCMNVNDDQTGLLDRRSENIVNIYTRICCCNVCTSNTYGSVECTKFLCVFYDYWGHIIKTVLDALLQLHKTSCRLLREKPVNEVNALPDVLKDLGDAKMTVYNIGLDILPTRYTNNQARSNHCETRMTLQSNHELNIICSKYRNYRCSHHGCSHRNINNTKYPNSQDGSSIDTHFKRGQDGRNLVKNNDCQSLDLITNGRIQSQNSTSVKSSNTIRKLRINYPGSTDESDFHQLNFSNQQSINQPSRENNRHHPCIIVPDFLIHPNQPYSQPRPHDVMQSETIVSDLQANPQTEQTTHHIDFDFTKDLVNALRNIGDNLDARMRYHNEPSVSAVFGATKISNGWLIHTALKHYSPIGVIVGFSLKFLHQLSRL